MSPLWIILIPTSLITDLRRKSEQIIDIFIYLIVHETLSYRSLYKRLPLHRLTGLLCPTHVHLQGLLVLSLNLPSNTVDEINCTIGSVRFYISLDKTNSWRTFTTRSTSPISKGP